MGEQSKIAWCDSTVNFLSGCTKVYLPGLKADQSGCQHCYAEELSKRFAAKQNWTMGDEAPSHSPFGKWGKGAPRQLHESAFKLAHRLNRKPWVCDECGEADEGQSPGVPIDGCYCNGKRNAFHRRRIFSLSLGDWLDPEIPVAWLVRMLDTIRQCPDVDWLLCTKRPELWRERLQLAFDTLCEDDQRGTPDMLVEYLENWLDGHPPQNIVFLASVENQDAADIRIPQLLRIPAWRRGLSCEPLLGPVDLQFFKKTWRADWVIVGGESGNKARPCNVELIRSLKDQCAAADVMCFVKQLGSNSFKPSQGEVIKFLRDPKGGDWNEWPADLRVREFYKP